MTLAILSTRRSTTLSFSVTAEKLGFSSTFPCVDTDSFLTALSNNPQAYAIVTTDYLQTPDLFIKIRLHTPCVTLCILPEHLIEIDSPLNLLDRLQLDALCGLDELPDCLKTLYDGRHFQSSLLTTSVKPIKQDTLSGWYEISPAEKDVLRLMLDGLKVPAIAASGFAEVPTLSKRKKQACNRNWVYQVVREDLWLLF